MIHHQSSDLDDYNLRDLILLNTGSTIGATVCNSKSIANVHPTTDTLHMMTNAGCKNVELQGEVLGLGNAWFDVKFITNIFGFLHLINLSYKITYDSTKEDAFICRHPDSNQVKFARTRDGLYMYKPTKNYIQEVEAAEAMSKSEKNFEGFSQDAEALTNFGENYDPTTDDVEALANFGENYDPTTKNTEAMPKF